MCGIFGMIGWNARVPVQVLESATRSLAHRGPDDGGSVILHDSSTGEIEIGLGNRRLAILDLSPLGHQPMTDPETGNWIIYNGEIYNFREVRTKLERAGFLFRSASDTEVILKAYAHWGEKSLDEFRGMFAFTIWDARRHCLFMARDPMGIKPLYYSHSDRYFLWSSEVRSLLGTGFVSRRIDSAGLISYLTFGSLYDPNTLVEGVRALPPGHFLNWKEGRITLGEYCDVIDPTITASAALANDGGAKSREQLENEVAQVLEESVRMQLVSDVPVGVFLSGGIDSSCLISILSRIGVRPSTFSIVFREADYSEAEFSRAVAKQFHTDHHEITVSQDDLLAVIEPAVHAMDLPTIDGVNTYFISQKARAAGIKVAISGLGGDEIFAGYSSFGTVPRMERIASTWRRMPGALREPLTNVYAALAVPSDQNRKLMALGRNGEQVIHPYFLSRMLFTPNQRNGLLAGVLSTGANADVLDFQRAEKPLTDCLSRAQSLDPINRVSYLETRCYMLNTLLRDSDSMSMAHGLELRVPLIDHRLARLVLGLPGAWKLDEATPKPLLVRNCGRELPDQIVHRKKRGFTLPFEHWLRDSLRPVVQKSLCKIEDGPLGGLIDQRAVCNVWKDFLAGRTSWSRPWSLYILQSWCQEHLVG